MEKYISLFISRREGFFKERACINCSVNKYCACEGADLLFDVDRVLRQNFVDVGETTKVSEPIKVDKNLATGYNILASLSHNGILAICVNQNTIQFTNLNSNEQVEMKVENVSIAAFYDNIVLLLTDQKRLRQVTMESVFENPTIKIFKTIEETEAASPFTDVASLQERRVLYYRTIDNRLFSFNVDTRENIEIENEKKIWTVGSLTGIDCGVEAIFQDCNDRCTYVLDVNNKITKVNEEQDIWLTTVFPSISNPKDIRNGLFKYVSSLMKRGSWIDTNSLIVFDGNYSVVRIYKNIFLVYDNNIKSWVLINVITS